MDKQYVSVVNTRSPRARSKRMRSQGQASVGSSTVVLEQLSASGTIETGSTGHTHANKSALDKISTDEDGYIYLTQQKEVVIDTGTGQTEVQTTTEKVKAGYADLAGNLADWSVGDSRYLSKVSDDTAQGKITFSNGLQVGTDFVSGLLGEGGVFRKDADGKTYIEADRLYVRMKAYFDTVEFRRYINSGGNRISSPAGGKCIKVEWLDSNGEVTDSASSVVKYRCYFRATDGEGNEVTNDFQEGDQAYCHISNIRNGSLYQHEYWRTVIGRNVEGTLVDGMYWIDLANTSTVTIGGTSYAGYMTGSDAPVEQDSISTLGSKNDSTRRGAIIEYVSGEDSPSYKIYQAIGTGSGQEQFSLVGKNQLELGYNSSTGRAYLNVYGDFFFGNKAQSDGQYTGSYIKYDAASGTLSIKGSISATSSIGDSTIEQYIQAHQLTYDDSELRASIGNLQSQIDGEIQTLFEEGDPTVSGNDPYAGYTATEKARHLGDLYYDLNTGIAYRYEAATAGGVTTYAWGIVKDTGLSQAIADAASALGLAGSKAKIFYTSAGVLPTPPYNVNDIWSNAPYPANGSTYSNDILRCVTARAEGATASITDWTKASKYTDDTALTAFINGDYSTFTSNIQTQVDGKAETWYQATDPSAAWTTTALKSAHVGDIWHNSSSSTINGVEAGQSAIWNGTSWDVSEVPAEVFNKIDGKASIFVNTVANPPTNYRKNDLWILPAAATINGVSYIKGEILTASSTSSTYSAAHWSKKVAYTNDDNLNNFINQILNGSGASGNAATAGNALHAIKEAVTNGETYNNGGLVLSNLMYLGTGSVTSGTFVPWAGINGIYKTAETGSGWKGHGIAAWYGGDMTDHEASPSATGYAKSLFRFDGSGYLASGNITWDKDGIVTIANVYANVNGTSTSLSGSLQTLTNLSNALPLSVVSGTTYLDPQYSFKQLSVMGKAVATRIPISGSTAYRRIVIALCELTDDSVSANSYSNGRLVFHRSTGVNPDIYADVAFDAKYSGAYSLHYSLYSNKLNYSTSQTTGTGVRPCRFKYNNVWYGGVEFYYSPAQHTVAYNGEGNFDVFKVDYYDTQNDAALDSEVYNSLDYTSDLLDGTLNHLDASEIRVGDCRITWDGTNNMLHFSTGIYSDGGVSALGANSSSGGGSGSGIDRETLFTILGGTPASGESINTAFLNLSGYATQTWANNRYVTLATAQTISATKTFSAQQAFTVASGTAPFTVASSTLVSHLNADMLDGWERSDILPRGRMYSSTASLADYWCKVWDYTMDAYNTNRRVTFLVNNGNGDTCAIIILKIRYNNSISDSTCSSTLVEVVGNIPLDAFRLYYDGTGYHALWANGSRYTGYSLVMLNKTSMSGAQYQSLGTMYNTTFTEAQTLPSMDYKSMTAASLLNSAASLTTARTIWGQSFDGSANVSGDMTGVGSVTMSGDLTATRTTTTATYLRAANSNGSIELQTATNRGLYDRTNTTWVIGTNGTDTWASQGNFGIGTTSPSYKLHVNGTAYATSLYLARSTFYMTSNSNSALVLYHNGDAGLVAGIADIHPASTNSGMTLGTSTYPWDRLYCTAATLTGNVSIGGTLGVTGAATLSSTLGVTGATTLSSTLGVTGNTTLGGDLYLGNAKYIRGKNQSDTYENLLGINSSNNLLIGYGHATSGITCVYGTNLYFKTNGTTNRLTIDSSGNAAFTGNVATSGYLDIGSARLIYDSTNNALKVIGTGGGVMNIYATGGVSALGMAGGADGTMSVALVPDTTNTYNLGASSYRWNYLYARYVNASGASTFSGNVRAASISVNAAANSSYKLYVNGEAYTTGSWGSSDERLKDIIGNPQVELSDIADAPIIEFTWKDKSAGDKPRLGSVAQYWRGVLPMAVKSDKGGWLSMQYGEVALACVVEVAKRTLSHEDRIKALEQENEELRQRIKTLEEAA